MKCDLVCDIDKLVLLLSFDPSYFFPAYTLVYHRKIITIFEFWKHKGTEQGFCCINREKVTNGANASYVNVCDEVNVVHMRVNSLVICKMESQTFSCSRERYDIVSKCMLSVILHLCAFIWTYMKTFHFVIIQLSLVFNHPIFDVRKECFHGGHSAMNILEKNRCFDLFAISKHEDT